MRTYRIAVTGGRDHQISGREADDLLSVFLQMKSWPDQDVTLVHGNCRGVDRQAANLVKCWGFTEVPFEAPWHNQAHCPSVVQPSGAAGPLRNWMMLKAADLLVAFPGGKGTANCIRQAGRLGVEVVEIGG